MLSTARLATRCATCRTESMLEVSQAIVDGRLTWKETFTCACGHGFEAGGVGLPSPAARRALRAQEGVGEVWVDQPANEKVVLVLTILLGLTAEQAGKLVRNVPARVYRGTRQEAVFVSEGLTRVGAEGRVVARLPARRRRRQRGR